jgi:hypothetical protein
MITVYLYMYRFLNLPKSGIFAAKEILISKGKNLIILRHIYRKRCKVTQYILFGNCSTYFGWYHHPKSRAQTTVSTASGICDTVVAICRYRGRVGTGLSVLWVAYATHSTLKPVPTLSR